MSNKMIDREYATFSFKIKIEGNEALIAQCKRLTKKKCLTKTFMQSVKNSTKQLELNV